MNNNLKALHNQIENKFYKDLYVVLNSGECRKYFFELMTQSIEEEVYDRYEPSTYERRRENSGLIDEKNYTYSVKFNKGGITVYMKNITKGVGRAFMIDEGIVTGKDLVTGKNFYEYGGLSRGITPRDFYTYMEILVEDDDKLKSIIQNQMGKKGWNLI